MIVFLDFEASSLAKESYPIEVAWVFEDARSRSCLIRPATGWTDWSPEAEKIHGITRERLLAEGVPVEAVVGEMMDALAGHELYASAPSWDGKWLSVLLRAAGFPRHALRLRRSDEAFLEAARAAMKPDASERDIADLVAAAIENTTPTSAPHRALPDARLELERWRLIRQGPARPAGSGLRR